MTATAAATMQAEGQEGMPARFDGKVGVVTGGASGIGEGIVRRLVEEGGRCLIAELAGPDAGLRTTTAKPGRSGPC
jgi:NAD(P)-dependent dehydrogenase (short-subunit alcohol dehydrogenase family)